MPRRKPKRRQHKLIAFKAYFDDDADILDWWESIEDGDRSEELRDVIRGHLKLPSKLRRTRMTANPIIDLPELVEVHRDTLWIKDALNDMPAYLERVIEHVLTHAQSVTVGQHPPRASPPVVVDNDPALTDAESERRTRRMKRATW
ncbi:MAG: hypothetical protein RLP44_21730 [Aggregatilineales bacterium]